MRPLAALVLHILAAPGAGHWLILQAGAVLRGQPVGQTSYLPLDVLDYDFGETMACAPSPHVHRLGARRPTELGREASP